MSEFADKANPSRLSEKTKDAINQFMKLPVFSEKGRERLVALGCTGPSQRNTE